MVLEISSTLVARLLDEAAASPEVEVCGLLFGRGNHVAGLQSCRNVAADPATAFEIDPAQLIAAHRAARAGGPQIAGCYHSHPSGTTSPSERDARAAVADGSIWIIVAGRDFGCWRAVVDGRVHGRFEAIDISACPPSSWRRSGSISPFG